MIYGQFQYFNDELSGWSRIVAVHKEGLRESVRQIGLLLSQQITSSANRKESNSFTDQLMVQEQQFDHLAHQIVSQQQRLERSASHSHGKAVAHFICQQQDTLRLKMQNAERCFIRTKYSCSAFLSSFFGHLVLAVQN